MSSMSRVMEASDTACVAETTQALTKVMYSSLRYASSGTRAYTRGSSP